jgi:hypothetical protein
MNSNEYDILTEYYHVYGNMIGGGSNPPNQSKKMPESVKLFLQTLKLSAEEIPVAGEIVALSNVIISSSMLFIKLMDMIKQSAEMKALVEQLSFKNGPDDCVKLVTQLTDDEIYVMCQFVPQILDDLKLTISDWISTIPNVGPVMALVVQRNATFESVNKMYTDMPQSTKDLFQNPDKLIVMGDELIEKIRQDLIGSETTKPEQSAGSFTSAITSGLGKVASLSANIAEKGLIISTAPTRFILRTVGLDKLVIGKTLEYFDMVLKPSLVGASECMKLIFPLFFVFLIVGDKCNIPTPSES